MQKILLLISLFISTFLWGQKFNFQNFDPDEVQAKYIYDFQQDSSGALYIAGSKGLLKYDGIKFHLINKYNYLKENFISHIYIDNKNQIWVAYYNKGVSRLIETFEGYNSQYFDIPSVLSITEDSLGIKIITSESKIGRYNLETNDFDFSLNELTALGVRKEVILANNKSVYLTDNGIYYLDKNNQYQAIEGTEYAYIKIIKENTVTNTFAFIVNNELNIYQYTDRLRKINSIPLTKLWLTAKVTDMEFGKEKIVLTTLGEGLYELNFIDQRLQAYSYTNFKKENGLRSNNLQSVYLDKDENLWIGYYGNGISLFTNKRTLWYDKTTGLADENILCVTIYKGKLAIGTDKGFSIIDFNDITNFNASTSFIDDRVKSIYTFDETLWIGTDNNGLFYMKNGKIIPFHFKTLQIQPQTVNCIEIHDNKLYVGTNNGLFTHDFSNGKEIHLGTNQGLVHNVIEYIFIDSKGRFWFDSPVCPIYSYYDGEFTLYKDIEGFDSYELSQIFETKDKEIIFSTMGDGIFVLKKDTFTHYYRGNCEILSDYVYFVVEDINHQIWLGHKYGLTKFNEKAKEFTQYQQEDNPLLKGINPTAYQLSADNTLWIGTESGLVKLNTENLVNEKQIPSITFKGVIINDTLVLNQNEITLPFSDYQLEFRYQAINLTSPKEISYQYKLDGFDKKWNAVSYEKLSAKYQSVIDGDYVFRLKVCLENSCNEKEINIKIHIAKPFWKTPTAFILSSLVILGLFFLIIYVVSATKNKQNRILETKVKRRTIELSKVNRLVEHKNKELEKTNEEINHQKLTLEVKNKEIDDSIQYAKKIQRAFILKDEYEEWEKYFSKTFIFDKPRDIVSGDFYWGHKTDKYIYIAVADCTGHGVPGAMLSMLGIAFMDQIMIQRPNIDTNKLLDELREKMINELSHQDKGMMMKEGMDISLVRIDIHTKQLQWSGANNPLYIIRKKNRIGKNFVNCKITENNDGYILADFRPDKQPIGFIHEPKPFNKIEIQLHKEDAIYLFSDGYVDQFGGLRYKKFMSKRFKPLLLSIHKLSSEEQKNILDETLSSWQNDKDQIDDICIVGVCI